MAAFNAVTVFTLDLREWLVYFEPWAVRWIVVPAYVLALPAIAVLIPPPRQGTTANGKLLWIALIAAAPLAFEVLWITQIAIAIYFRGPNWNFYWPWEERVPRVDPLNIPDLSEWFWVYWLNTSPRPEDFFLRELAGLALLAIHLIVAPAIACGLLRRYWPHVSTWRIALAAVSFQLLSFTALKIVLRLTLMHYIVNGYEWNVNL